MEKTVYISPEHIGNVFGPCDDNVKRIENRLGVSIVNRGDDIKVIGPDEMANRAADILKALESFSEKGQEITAVDVNYLCTNEEVGGIKELTKEYIISTKVGKPIRPKNFGQKQYVEAVRNNIVTFVIGPAGTGKTYLAVAMAVAAFKRGDVSRIILTRPAIEAGERLGFLPGDLQQKIDPYLRPLNDSLFEILGPEAAAANKEKGAIEIAPLAYMRGRTLDNAFIILDEAQNTTSAQMKMFLTRLGFGSRAIVNGDKTQIDLPEGQKSGLLEAEKILAGVEGIGMVTLTNRDVVRHELVQKIVEAYEKHDKLVAEERKNNPKPASKERR